MSDDPEHAVKLTKEVSQDIVVEQETTQPQAEASRSIERKPWGIDEKTFLILMHLSLLSGFIIPFGSIVLPLAMWLTNKDEFPEVDAHGKVIANWIVSFAIYMIGCAVLSFALIGIPLAILISIYAVVVVVIASIKASDGQLWHYPGAIKFFK